MARIFLSHSSQDTIEAVALKEWLAQKGWADVFLDDDPERGLAAGDRWQAALSKASDRCEAVLFVVSPAWAKSKWCLAEFLLAKSLHKQIFGVVLKEVPLGELPTEMTSESQLCWLTGPGCKEIVKFSHRGAERTVGLLADGLERLKRGLKKAGLSADFFPWPPEDEPLRSPFRGLEPLDLRDAAVFFGRDVEILRGLDAFRGLRNNPAKRLFVILGASGTGKSSFLRAGLLPRLARDDRHFLPLGVVRPETAPISGDRGLAQALHETMKVLDLRGSNPGDLKARLLAEPKEFASILRVIQEASRSRLVGGEGESPSPAPTLVLPVDQAEELFNADAGPEARKFLSLIAGIQHEAQRSLAASFPPVSLIVAFTIRSDRYDSLQTAPELAELQQVVFNELRPMPATRFAEVIAGPARCVRASGGRFVIQPELVNQLVKECASGADTLPLLGLTLERLHRDYRADGHLTVERYKQLGELRQIVKSQIESVLDRDPARRQAQLAMLRRAFIPELVTINRNNDQPMRRVARRMDLPPDALPLLDALADKRLILRDLRGGHAVLEVAHEAVLRHWDDFAGWLGNERFNLKEADALILEAGEWACPPNDDSRLWRGQRLKHANALAQRPDFANRLAGCAEFLKHSQTREQEMEDEETKRKARLKGALVVTLVFAACLAIACVWAIGERSRKIGALVQATNALAEANQNVIRSQSQALVAEARQAPETRPFQSLLLASAAVENTRRHLADNIVLPAAHQTLRDALANIGGRPLLGHTNSVMCVATSQDGRWVVTGSLDNTACLWDLKATNYPVKPTHVLRGHKAGVTAVAFSPDSRWLVTGSADKTVRVWDLEDDPAAHSFLLHGHTSSVNFVNVTPDGRWVVTASGVRFNSGDVGDETVHLWKLGPKGPATQSMPLKGDGSWVHAVAISPDSGWIVVGSSGSLRVWKIAMNGPDGEPHKLEGQRLVTAVAVTPDNRWIVACSAEPSARLWKLDATGPSATSQELVGQTVEVAAIVVSLDSRWVVTGSRDATARVWQLGTEGATNLRFNFKGHASQVTALAFSPDSRWLVTGTDHDPTSVSYDNTARLWDLRNTNAPDHSIVLRGHDSHVNAVAVSPDSGWVVTGSADKTARLWNLKTVAPVVQPVVIKGSQSGVAAVAFSPDSHMIVTASDDGTVRVWDANTPEATVPLKELKGRTSGVTAVALSSDSRMIVTASNDGTVRVWDASTPEATVPLKELKGRTQRITAVALSPNGRWILTGSSDGIARMWDVNTGGSSGGPTELRGHQEEVNAVAFSPDSRWVVTGSGRRFGGSKENTTRLWDLKAATHSIELRGRTSSVNAVAVSPDNRWVVTGSGDAFHPGNLHLWLLQIEDLLDLARRTAGRNLSTNEWNTYLPGRPYFKVFRDMPIPKE